MQHNVPFIPRRVGTAFLGRKAQLIALAVLPLVFLASHVPDSASSAQLEHPLAQSHLPSPSNLPQTSTEVPAETAQESRKNSEIRRVKTVAEVRQSDSAGDAADKLQAGRLLQQADQSSSKYAVVGPNTQIVVDLYEYFETAGWNDCLDGMVMKSCPEGYEIFCQTRDAFFRIYEQTGGKIDPIMRIFRNMDFRDVYYQLASNADSHLTSMDNSSADLKLTR